MHLGAPAPAGPGITHGETDDLPHDGARDAASAFDLDATILRCMGIDHERLTHR